MNSLKGYNNGDFLRKWALDTSSGAFKILLNGELIGAYILWINQAHQNQQVLEFPHCLHRLHIRQLPLL